ncbi:ribonucleoside hydrolase RihC [Staphylococcus simulans]|uniref:ribonucleoside hydrolase RihC n=1 Tax=Staphylococcus simulans TaxID=1286 RepID=UPI000D039897|nr:ribonucleoside hydrolase RihC [Staphylococcus simulans]MCD8914442.1 ribonucleoside hydrolase RihC [Staphylococcus simulans]
MTIPIILDTDPGIDDAAAISIALNHPEIDVKMISTVHGNVNIDKTTRNALQLKGFFNSEVPVHRGAAAPLINNPIDASHVHGETGMGGYKLPEPDPSLLSSNSAIQAMKETLLNADTPITIVPIGPLTNIALLFKTYPEVKTNVKEIVLMGGSAGRGNVTPAAEFNIYCDPEAADIVFNAGLPITMVGLDVARGASLSSSAIEELKSINKTTDMLYHMFNHYHGDEFDSGLAVYDAYTMLYLLHSDDFKTADAHVDIELNGEHTRGATVVDYNADEKPVTVVLAVDKSKFKRLFYDALAHAK